VRPSGGNFLPGTRDGEQILPKGYWVSAHRRDADPEKHAAYAKIAKAAVEAAGGKFLAVESEPQTRESGLEHRTVVIEFPTHEAAIEAYESDGYRRALAALGDSAERDLRIIRGLE
jgi:uncharacterized protein (DUF1330 family)